MQRSHNAPDHRLPMDQHMMNRPPNQRQLLSHEEFQRSQHQDRYGDFRPRSHMDHGMPPRNASMQGPESSRGSGRRSPDRNQQRLDAYQRYDGPDRFDGPGRFDGSQRFGGPERFDGPRRFDGPQKFDGPQRFEAPGPQRFEGPGPQRFEGPGKNDGPQRFDDRRGYSGDAQSSNDRRYRDYPQSSQGYDAGMQNVDRHSPYNLREGQAGDMRLQYPQDKVPIGERMRQIANAPFLQPGDQNQRERSYSPQPPPSSLPVIQQPV